MNNEFRAYSDDIGFARNFDGVSLKELSAIPIHQDKRILKDNEVFIVSGGRPSKTFDMIKTIHDQQKKIDKLKEALGFYANGGNPSRDIWEHAELGYFTGKRAKQVLKELEETDD